MDVSRAQLEEWAKENKAWEQARATSDVKERVDAGSLKNDKNEKKKEKTEGNPSLLSAIAGVTVWMYLVHHSSLRLREPTRSESLEREPQDSLCTS